MVDIIIETDVEKNIREQYFNGTQKCYRCIEYKKEVLPHPTEVPLDGKRYTYIKMIITNIACKRIEIHSNL